MTRISLASALLCCALLGNAARAADPPKITVFVAKKIYTMDPGWPEATAVAVQGGKILTAGTVDEVKLYLGKTPFEIDERFQDKILMPGFVEAHGHPLIGGTTLTRPLLTYLPTGQAYGPDFPGVKTLGEALERLKEYVAAEKNPERNVVAWGYDVLAMGRLLDKTILDGVSVTQPVVVWDASEHMVFANSAAMIAAHLPANVTKINGVGVGEDGAPNGQFIGPGAAQILLAPLLAELLQPRNALKNMKFITDLGRKNGLTTTSEMVLGIVNLDLEERLFDMFFNDPNGTQRCVAVTSGLAAEEAKKLEAISFVKGLESKSTDRLMFHGVKFFADDAYLSLSMQVENPGYSDGHTGFWNVKPGHDMFEQWKPWWDAGFQIHVHTNGNAGNRATLDTLAALQNHKPRFDHRFTCQHFGISTEEQAFQAKALNALVSMNPYYLYARSELTAPSVGAERAYTAARFKTLLDAGVKVSMHSDTPVGTPRPLEMVWIAVNRFGLSGTVRGPFERITPLQAFRMVTIDAAYTLGVEYKVGSISPGKFADFAVLENDPFTVPVEKIRDVKVWGTVLGGKVLPASEIKP
jgi:predicted amidohydrolase YtcJ